MKFERKFVPIDIDIPPFAKGTISYSKDFKILFCSLTENKLNELIYDNSAIYIINPIVHINKYYYFIFI